MRYAISEEALTRASKRFGSEAAKMLKTKIFFVNDWVDPLTARLCVSPSDLRLVYDSHGWNPFPEIKPQIDSKKIHIVTDDARNLYLARWSKGKWIFLHTNDQPSVIAFHPAPMKYMPDKPLDNHPDAIAARKYIGNDRYGI